MNDAVVRPPFDAAIGRALHELADIVVTGMTPGDLEAVRAIAQPFPLPELTLHGAYERSEHTAPGVAGAPAVATVVYTPADAKRPVPVLLHLHGGGLIAGTADADTPGMIALAQQVGFAMVTVEYRLAPEHPYPAALEDAASALAWLASGEAPALCDPRRIVLSGVSAGGGLAAATALHARDTGGAQAIGQLLMCPMLDHRSDSLSAWQMQGVGSWDRTANATAWEAYLGGAEDQVPGHASAARALDLAGLPPAFIDVGSAETFRDECVTYASRLWAAGADAELHVWPGGAHGFDFLAPWSPLAHSARAARVDWLRRLAARH